MIVKPQIWTLNTEAIESNTEWGKEWFLPKIDIMVREGVLVPDTRLQAIADAAGESFIWCFTHGQKRLQCEWAKKLYECSDVDDAVIVRASLLDVLAEEEQ